MTFRILIFISLWSAGPLFSQSVDSLQLDYKKYHNTSLVAQNQSGKYLVLNHNNSYGKNEDELYNIKQEKGTPLPKNHTYRFLGDVYLMMQNTDRTRFQNLNTSQFKDIKGRFVTKIIKKTNHVLLYGSSAKELCYYRENGERVWSLPNVQIYEVDEQHDRLIYFDGQKINLMDLKTQSKKSYKIDSTIQWIKSSRDYVYFANIQKSHIDLYTLDLVADRISEQRIVSPDSFEFPSSLMTYFEIREDAHFIFPLYLKSKLNEKQNPELQITYSNRNSKDTYLNHHLGIFNFKTVRWDYKPNTQEKLPTYKFLNNNGDFVVYDQSKDAVEDQSNVVRDMTLVLGYGKRSYLLPQKRERDGNYLWDSRTEKFVYFNDERWMCHHVKTGKTHELLPLATDGWSRWSNNTGRSGLKQIPEVKPILVKNRAAVLLSNQFDYFIVDLDTYHLERITKGEEKQLKYKLQSPKEDFVNSPWNLGLAQVDLEKDLMFKLSNEKTLQSGFVKYIPKSKKTIVYNEGHFREAIPYNDGILFTSAFALEPFTISKIEKGKNNVVYEALKEEKKLFDAMRYQIFQYTTSKGTAKALLLFPIGYDQQKKYPLIVNVYENRTVEAMYFTVPSLRGMVGFNYMHYLLNGYFVLLPDLQYEIGNVQKTVIQSLEKSIDEAKMIGSIDEKNIGIVGESFGGYETGLALTKSNYFKTGVAGVGLFDLVSFALSNTEAMSAPNYHRVEDEQSRMKDNVFDSWSNYLENSPVYHLKNIKSPMLIWTGAKDPNVPPAQSKMFFLGMKRLQKKAVLLEYTNETHVINSAKNQQDLSVRISQWFDYHLKNKTPAEWISPITK